jgi:hypothetical protein
MVDQGVVRLLGLSTAYTLAALILVGLRATGAISWAWLWVLCPLWLPFVLTGIAFASFVIVRLIEQPPRRAIPLAGRPGRRPLCPLSLAICFDAVARSLRDGGAGH